MKSRHHIRVPFSVPGPPKDGLYKFKFEKPSAVKLVGAYALKAVGKSSSGIMIDVVIMMPDVCSLLRITNVRALFRRKITWTFGTFTSARVTCLLLRQE